MLQNRKGFTLIELLIVVVIIGILAAVAIPKFGKSREKAYVAAMQSDLKQVMTAQEIYYGDPAHNYSYATCDKVTAEEPGDCKLEVTPSAGVTLSITAAEEDEPASWYAIATHSATDQVCDVFVGTNTKPSGVKIATTPGVIACGTEGDTDD